MNFKYLLIIPCIVLLFLIKTAASWGLADYEAYKAREYLFAWEETPEKVNSPNWNQEWEEAFSYAEKALERNSGNPDLMILLANIYLWKKDGEEKKSNQRLALDYYRQATVRRPSWPYTWVDIALVKYQLNEHDTEFYAAVENAMMLGPWEPKVQLIISEIGLAGWKVFDYEQRLPIIENIKRGIVLQPEAILELLKKHDQLRLVCHGKLEDPLVKKYCEAV